jgi:hypothetical protein
MKSNLYLHKPTTAFISHEQYLAIVSLVRVLYLLEALDKDKLMKNLLGYAELPYV